MFVILDSRYKILYSIDMSTALGLDIGTSSIKYLEVTKDKSGPQVTSYGLIPTPPGAVQSEASADIDALVEAIKRVIHDGGAKSQDVTIALPDSQVFTRVIEVPNLSDKELANSIHWEAEQYIPMPLDEVYMDFSKLRTVTSSECIAKLEILLVAAPKLLVDKFQRITEAAGLTPIAMETDVLSISRALVPPNTQSPAMLLVNIGAQTTSIAVLEHGIIAFSRSVEIAGTALPRAVAQEFIPENNDRQMADAQRERD